MLIARQAIAEFLDRDFNSYLWMKRLKRAEILAELKQFKVKPEFVTEPWLHQLVCFYIGLCEPRFLFLLDMGLGKSKILLDLIWHALRDGSLDKALVLVPRLVNIDSWMDDVVRHSALEPWHVMVEDIEEKWYRLAYPHGDLTIIDYQGLSLAVCDKKKGKLVRNEKKMAHLQRTYNFINLDESHKLKNHNNLWFSLARQLTKHADRVYATTGTLFGKEVEDLWSQFFLVDRGETFGENLGLFRASFFVPKAHSFGDEYVFQSHMSGKLNRMIQNRSLRYDDDEVDELPKLTFVPVNLDMTPEQREHYLRAVQGLVDAKGGDASAIDAPWLRMRQICSGYLKWRDATGDHLIRFKGNPKLAALERYLDEMGDSKMVVCYDYTDTGRMIHERLIELKIKHEWFYGGTKDKPGSRQRFLTDPSCMVFLMNSEAGGTGNDGLQKVARYMYFFESPTPPITRKQTEKRIHRPGQQRRSFIYDPVLRGSVERGILNSLQEGRDLYDSIVKGRFSKATLLGLDT